MTKRGRDWSMAPEGGSVLSHCRRRRFRKSKARDVALVGGEGGKAGRSGTCCTGRRGGCSAVDAASAPSSSATSQHLVYGADDCRGQRTDATGVKADSAKCRACCSVGDPKSKMRRAIACAKASQEGKMAWPAKKKKHEGGKGRGGSRRGTRGSRLVGGQGEWLRQKQEEARIVWSQRHQLGRKSKWLSVVKHGRRGWTKSVGIAEGAEHLHLTAHSGLTHRDSVGAWKGKGSSSVGSMVRIDAVWVYMYSIQCRLPRCI